MNLQISTSQAQKFACEIFIADIKNFIADRPEAYQLYLEGEGIADERSQNKKFNNKES